MNLDVSRIVWSSKQIQVKRYNIQTMDIIDQMYLREHKEHRLKVKVFDIPNIKH
jgi:hypothetical protein